VRRLYPIAALEWGVQSKFQLRSDTRAWKEGRMLPPPGDTCGLGAACCMTSVNYHLHACEVIAKAGLERYACFRI